MTELTSPEDRAGNPDKNFLQKIAHGIQGILYIKQNLNYRGNSRPEERERAPARAEAFKNDMMSFFQQPDWEEKLPILNLSEVQWELFDNLVKSIKNNTLRLDKTIGNIRSDNAPFLCRFYSDHQPVKNDFVGRLEDLLGGNVHLITRYGPRQPFSHSFTVYSDSINSKAGSISFVTFPIKPPSTVYVAEMLGIEPEYNGITNSVGVYGDAERIIIDSQAIRSGQYLGATTQYFKIDKIRGAEDYWLYGSNSEIHERTSISDAL